MPSPHSLSRIETGVRRFTDWGEFSAVGSRGARYGLIGHDSADVWAWLSAHPGFDGSIYFDLCDGGDAVDVTSEFEAVEPEAVPARYHHEGAK
jgi:hypothetical protein